MSRAAHRAGRMAPALALALVLAVGVTALVSCGGTSSAASRPRPQATDHAVAAPRLIWHEGQRLDVDAQVQQADLATAADRAVPTSLSVRISQSLQVTAAHEGRATLRVETTRWTRLENRSELIAPSPPGPFQVQVDPRGVLEAGEYWSLPSHPRPPGIDLFSAGLPDHHVERGDRWPARWQRTGRDDLPLAYQVSSFVSQASAEGLTVDSHLDWDVAQLSNTAAGDLERLQGTGHGDVRSGFDLVRGQVRETSYTVTYDTTDTTGASAVHTQGSFHAELRFRYR